MKDRLLNICRFTYNVYNVHIKFVSICVCQYGASSISEQDHYSNIDSIIYFFGILLLIHYIDTLI